MVGGAVRDRLLGRAPRDIDLVAEAGPAGIKQLLDSLSSQAGWTLVIRHDRFGTATLTAPCGTRVDVASSRSEVYPKPGSLPVITGAVPLHEDLGRRDFSIHAMARRLGPQGRMGPVLDPFGGRSDLQRGIVRLLHDRSFVDDPTRALRAVRYAARLGFQLERRFGVRLAASREEGAWQSISGDRLRRALEEVLAEDEVGRAVTLASREGVLPLVSTAWERATATSAHAAEVQNAPTLEARWNSLLAPLPADDRWRVAQRLCFSRNLRKAAGVKSSRSRDGS